MSIFRSTLNSLKAIFLKGRDAPILNVWTLSKVGKRKNQEDCIYPKKWDGTGQLFVVCDGVGGINKGEVASSLTCKAFAEVFEDQRRFDTSLVDDAINKTASLFQEHIQNNPDAKDMSTTLTYVFMEKSKVHAGWCGDSRIYVFRDGQIQFKSKDHSLVQRLIDVGEITEEEAVNHPQNNVITRAVNENITIEEVEMVEIEDVRSGDYIFLCSDGILEAFNDEMLCNLFSNNQSDVDFESVINEHCLLESKDNYSMILIEV